MPILFVHGVAIREEDRPEWEEVRRITQGFDWPTIRKLLREYVAPVLNPDHPGEVSLQWIYWGDLGASYRRGGAFLASRRPELPAAPDLLAVPPEMAAQWVEDCLLENAPAPLWPAIIQAAAEVARDEVVRSLLASVPPDQRAPVFLSAALSRAEEELPRPLHRLDKAVKRRGRHHRRLAWIRRPVEEFVPIFLGDVMTYLSDRGTPDRPGPVPKQLLQALRAARQAPKDEPLVILSHSMGGQIVYDVLNTFAAHDPELRGLKVDCWCTVGSQVGLFKELGLTLQEAPTGDPVGHFSETCRYFWNVWSYGDLLSFRAEGNIPGAHDAAFPLGGQLHGDHMAYLQEPIFYEALAAKLRAVQLAE